MAKQKFEVIRPWAGVLLGDVLELDPKKMHPAIKPNVRAVVKASGGSKADGAEAEGIIAAAKAEAESLLAVAKAEAEELVKTATATAESILGQAHTDAEAIKAAATAKK